MSQKRPFGGRTGFIALSLLLSFAAMAATPNGMNYGKGPFGAEKDTVTMPLKVYTYGSLTSNVALSPDGTKFVTGSGSFLDARLRVWDIAAGTVVHVSAAQRYAIDCVAYSPDGTKLLSAATDCSVKLWDAATGAELWTSTGHTVGVNSAAFSPDGTRVLTGSDDKTAILWDAATGAQLRVFTGHSDSVYAVVFSPDGTQVLTGSADKTAKLWNAATGEALRSFAGHTGAVRGVRSHRTERKCSLLPRTTRQNCGMRHPVPNCGPLRGMRAPLMRWHSHQTGNKRSLVRPTRPPYCGMWQRVRKFAHSPDNRAVCAQLLSCRTMGASLPNLPRA